jgi:hypothetical protein
MQAIGKRLTYSNVVSTLALFLVLAGGAAYAAKVPKKSVGPSQLKANAVTTAKIKANAVTTRKIKKNAVANGKIKDGAVESAKIADGSVNRTDLAEATLPYSRIVHEARGNATIALTKAKITSYPLSSGATYTQEAGRDDLFTGAVDVTFDPACTAPRAATVFALLDPPDPSKLTSASGIVAAASGVDETGTRPSLRISMGPYQGASFQPTAPTGHNLAIGIQLNCTAGDGGKATFGAIDVIGTKK